jgi:hypothetical protein
LEAGTGAEAVFGDEDSSGEAEGAGIVEGAGWTAELSEAGEDFSEPAASAEAREVSDAPGWGSFTESSSTEGGGAGRSGAGETVLEGAGVADGDGGGVDWGATLEGAPFPL